MKHYNFKKWNCVRCLAALLAFCLLTGCTPKLEEEPDPAGDREARTEAASGENDTELFLENDEASYSNAQINVRYPEKLTWNQDKSVVQYAIDNQVMVIQFMSGEGCYITGSSVDNTTKWGDSVLLVFPNGETMLIDAGMMDYGWYLVENLKILGIERLDYCMLSHPHVDHSGGFSVSGGIFDSFEVGTFFYTGIYSGVYSDRYKLQLEKLARLNGIEIVTLARGDKYWFGDVSMTVLSPEKGRVGESSGVSDEECNADSIAARFDFGETSYLTCGDFYVSTEKEIMEKIDPALLSADIVKMNHHGRTTSNCDEWCEAVGAKIAVATGSIEVTNSTYSSYAKAGTVPYVDTYDGFIRVMAKNDGTFTVVTSRERSHAAFDELDKKYNIVRTSSY